MQEPVTVEVVESSRGRGGHGSSSISPTGSTGAARSGSRSSAATSASSSTGSIPPSSAARRSSSSRAAAGEPVGTIGAIDNAAYNEYHQSRIGPLPLLRLRRRPRGLARPVRTRPSTGCAAAGMDKVIGPFGFGFMGMGALVEGFEHRAVMTMMAYNRPWYGPAIEAEGFVKHRDQLSMFIDARQFRLPGQGPARRRDRPEARQLRGAGVPDQEGSSSARAQAIGQVYNESFASHGDEFYPLSEKEIRQITADLVTVADPSLIKLLLCKGEIAGFLFGFPDLSAALQRSRGRITPWGIVDLLLEYRRTRWLIVNGAGDPSPVPEARRQRAPVLHAGEDRLRAGASSTWTRCRSRKPRSSCSPTCRPSAARSTRSTGFFRGRCRRVLPQTEAPDPSLTALVRFWQDTELSCRIQ